MERLCNRGKPWQQYIQSRHTDQSAFAAGGSSSRQHRRQKHENDILFVRHQQVRGCLGQAKAQRLHPRLREK
jgi:hypothetical protein